MDFLKKYKYWILVWLLVFVVIIVWIFTKDFWIKLITPTDKEVLWILEKFDDQLNLDKSNIIEEDFEWINYNTSPSTWIIVHWFSLSWVSSILPSDMIDTSKFFNWWTVNYVWDEIHWSRVEFSKNNIFCYYNMSLEQEFPYELMAWEDKDWNPVDIEKWWEEFYKKATYSIDLRCWRLPKNIHRLIDQNYDIAWQEPFWNASIRWWRVTLFDTNWVHYYYPDFLKYDWDRIEISWYHILWFLENSGCFDEWIWLSHWYTASFDFINENEDPFHYEWCADIANFDFVQWEEWTLSHFIEMTNYDYNHEYNIDDVNYIIAEVINNYMEVKFYINDKNWEHHDFQVIMEKVGNNREVLFDWNYDQITDEECGELNQHDNNLMDMFFLVSCPRG